MWVPAMPLKDRPVPGYIPVEVLRRLEPFHEMSAKRGFTDLPRAGKQNHLAIEIGCDEIIQIAFHGDYFIDNWKKVATFFQ